MVVVVAVELLAAAMTATVTVAHSKQTNHPETRTTDDKLEMETPTTVAEAAEVVVCATVAEVEVGSCRVLGLLDGKTEQVGKVKQE